MTGRQEYDRTKDRQRILGKYMIDKSFRAKFLCWPCLGSRFCVAAGMTIRYLDYFVKFISYLIGPKLGWQRLTFQYIAPFNLPSTSYISS
jgi:hypothetical protein